VLMQEHVVYPQAIEELLRASVRDKGTPHQTIPFEMN
jgi:hypothetical protein